MFSSKIHIIYYDIYQAYTENKINYLKICKIINIFALYIYIKYLYIIK